MNNINKNTIEMIPISQVHVPNPRARNQKQYGKIADNVKEVGLKRPITVTASKSPESDKKYDLVCGQGRLEIFIAYGQTEIPAIIIDASEEEAMVMSIVENMARRQHSPMDLMKGIELLVKQGYSNGDISKKTGLTLPYVRDIINLIEKGEERLISAVETGIIPISLAALIADSPGDEQKTLQEAYEHQGLKGKRLLLAKKLIEDRDMRGKSIKRGSGIRGRKGLTSAHDVLQAYQHNVNKKKLLVQKSEMTNNNLIFITEALRQMYEDENFKNILKLEGLESFPKPIDDMIKKNGGNCV